FLRAAPVGAVRPVVDRDVRGVVGQAAVEVPPAPVGQVVVFRGQAFAEHDGVGKAVFHFDHRLGDDGGETVAHATNILGAPGIAVVRAPVITPGQVGRGRREVQRDRLAVLVIRALTHGARAGGALRANAHHVAAAGEVGVVGIAGAALLRDLGGV